VHRVVLAALLAACSNHPDPSAPAQPRGSSAPSATSTESGLRDGPPLATPGERMQYQLSLRGIDLATYELAIGELTEFEGKRVILVQGHAKTRGFVSFFAMIDDRFTSWVDITSGRSLRFQTDEYASGSKTDIEHSVIDFARRSGDTIPMHYHVNDAPPHPEAQKASLPVAWDYNAFLLALRGWEGPPGSRLSLEVFRSRSMWHVDVTIHGKEKRVTDLGDLPALRIDGRTFKLQRNGVRAPDDHEREFTMWISDDDGRVPLEIKAVTDYGDLRMKIIDYQPGNGQRLRP
jgi:hypothetical protein